MKGLMGLMKLRSAATVCVVVGFVFAGIFRKKRFLACLGNSATLRSRAFPYY